MSKTSRTADCLMLAARSENKFVVAVGGRGRAFDCVNGFGRQDPGRGVKCFVGHTHRIQPHVAEDATFVDK